MTFHHPITLLRVLSLSHNAVLQGFFAIPSLGFLVKPYIYSMLYA
jgi:hypothetical protein